MSCMCAHLTLRFVLLRSRALLVNEFQSDSYVDGDKILTQVGFTYGQDNKPFDQAWVGYCFSYILPYFFLCLLMTALGLTYVKTSPSTKTVKTDSKTSSPDNQQEREATLENEFENEGKVEIPFKPVTITFEDVCYDVKASKGKESLRLLHNVHGIFRSGRMCALMGSSGAG